MKRFAEYLLRLTCLIVFFSTSLKANDSTATFLASIKETHVYATKDSNVLRLDKYTLKHQSAKQPCVFFLFGGSFRGGRKDNPAYFSYFEALVRKGYVVIVIDYRLGLKNVDRYTGDGAVLERAVKMSLEDLYDATAFTLKHAKAWNIDTSMVVISGSSAGALAVLRAAYDLDNKTIGAGNLTPHFSYAGVIAFAGAIFCPDRRDLAWNENKPCPMLLFHGRMDKVVPYEHFRLGNSGIFGPKYISAKLDSLNRPYWLFTVENGGHEVANTPMNENHSEIFKFLEDLVLKKKQIRMQTSYSRLNNQQNEPKPVLEDFIKNNFLAR